MINEQKKLDLLVMQSLTRVAVIFIFGVFIFDLTMFYAGLHPKAF